jgi:hypothetical protein
MTASQQISSRPLPSRTLPVVVDATPATSAAQGSEFIQPDSDEVLIFMRRCIEERGWVVVDNGSGGIQIEFPPEQQAEATAAMRECSKQSLRLAPGETVPPPSDRQVRDYFQALINSAEYLKTRGFDLSDPPSLDAYLEGGIGSWDPFGEILTVTGMGPSEFDDITRECPQPELYR